MQKDQVVLVDTHNRPVGAMDKMEAHIQGRLHRAFSVFVFNERQELLLQRRALSKYHSGGMWSNTCCSHPQPAESTLHAVRRRLVQEMGMYVELTHIGDMTYRTHVDNGLIEHEYDKIYIGFSAHTPQPNHHEVAAWQYLTRSQIADEIIRHPDDYTPWFKLIVPHVWIHLEQRTPSLKRNGQL